MKQPPSIQPAPRQGPNYDPMDRLVENLQNIQNFLSKLSDNPEDLKYLDSHINHILPLRRSISQQLDLLFDEPYNYPHDRLVALHKENEKIFSHIEGIVGAMHTHDLKHFQKFLEAAETIIDRFDEDLTP